MRQVKPGCIFCENESDSYEKHAIQDGQAIPTADSEKMEIEKLTRDELLRAIDFEMAQRQSTLSRHGVSTWGIVAAVAALLWTATVEALAEPHNWTHVLLILVAANSFLGLIFSPWLKAIGVGNPVDLNDHSRTLNAALYRAGLASEVILAHSTLLALNMAIAVYLGFQGFRLLAITSVIFYAVLICFLSFCWLLSRLKIPLSLKRGNRNAYGMRTKVLVWLLVIVVAFVPMNAAATIWPADKGDIRLGLILAAFECLIGTSLMFVQQSPMIARLQSLRSRVGLGLIEIESAKSQLETILYGPPEEDYLIQKVDSIAAVMEESIRLWKRQIDDAQRMIVLADQLRSSPSDQPLLRKVTVEFRSLHQKLLRRFGEIEKQAALAVKLKLEFSLRVETANAILDLRPELVNQLSNRVDELWKNVREFEKKFANLKEQFVSALDFLYVIQKDVKVPQKMKLRDAYTAFFRD